jgi:hypothetical protein
MTKTFTALGAAALIAFSAVSAEAKNSTKFQSDMMTIARGDDKPAPVAAPAADATGSVTKNKFTGGAVKPCIVSATNACK